MEVELKGNGNVGNPVKLSDANDWTYTWTGLPEYAAGNEIVYSVEEVTALTGYVTTYDYSTAGVALINNKHIPEVTTIKGSKTWVDADNQDGLRPASIDVDLMDGTT
ncbi:MAG: Cna B-type domain-containing protein, partial [Clostridiaceae bacterium]